ncbi:MAG: ribosome small subunit-dependent GTPase A, partial [Acetanaerobacterium sp.]
TSGETGVIDEILPRRNDMSRPPIANINTMVFVVSTTEPVPNTLVLDKLLAIAQFKAIAQVIVITKVDIKELSLFQDVYQRAGFPVFIADYDDPESIGRIRAQCAQGLTVFCGNSGVGKSTLINAIAPGLDLKTAEISQKLGRGRHTTRSVTLYPMDGGGYIADSPGFSSLETNRLDTIYKDELQYCFREFAPFIDRCRYKDCSHIKEPGCAVLEALGNEIIPKSRHDSYVRMYEEARSIKEWEQGTKRRPGKGT